MLFALLFRPVPAPAATNSAPLASDLAAQLRLRLQETRTELGAISTAGDGAPPSGATAPEATERRLMLEGLVRNYQEHLDQLSRLEESRHRLQELEQTIKSWQGFSESPPYSVLLVDELRDSVESLQERVSASESTLAILETLTQDSELTLRKSEEQLRLLNEQLESAKDAGQISRLTWQRTLANTRSRHASAMSSLNETRRRTLESDLVEQRQRLAFTRRQLAIASQHTRFSEADLRRVLAGVDAEQRDLEKELEQAEAEVSSRQTALAATREDYRQALQNAPGASASSLPSQPPSSDWQARLELLGVEADTSAQRLAVLRNLLDAIVSERGLWQLRYATMDSKNLDQIREGYQRLEHLNQLIQSVRPYFRQQIDLAVNLINLQHSRMQSYADAAPAQARALLETYQDREALALRALRGLERLERRCLRWKESLDEDRQHLPLLTRTRDLFGGLSSFAAKLWRFELFTAEDSITVDGQTITGRRSVTVGKILMALLILAIGYWLAGLFSRLMERLAVRHLKIEPNQARLIRRWARVALVLGLLVFSLVSVKIPLTVFAFLGGALAIGLGFGTQNLLKNFISGIIILFERPFRVGDVLDVSGSKGKVIGIGIRSSVIKLWDNTETLIPNSTLLENNVTNWTYSDHKVRFSVMVGAAYGSDTRLVSQLLEEAARRHGQVQKEPAPQVYFVDFGDSALNFELRYWVDVMAHNSLQIGSDLRHMIVGSFAEHRIDIAFPQRDLHLHTAQPLRVHLEKPKG
jgi:small-conductance mechanosensitive channel/predicted  nucleic acid-binding Zn-ribbon protein